MTFMLEGICFGNKVELSTQEKRSLIHVSHENRTYHVSINSRKVYKELSEDNTTSVYEVVGDKRDSILKKIKHGKSTI
jgi:hypothetical protein